MGIIQNTGKNIFFSFLYNAGDINSTTCIMKNGSETINAANNAIFKLDTKTSGNPVNIILLLSTFCKRLNNGFAKSSLTKEVLIKKKKKQIIKKKKL